MYNKDLDYYRPYFQQPFGYEKRLTFPFEGVLHPHSLKPKSHSSRGKACPNLIPLELDNP